ncbi:uncharacterized protein LOC143861673 [Tasmannia lanceolata]|uniref:uncharacterized protein LOC143861673 n=1 Tax=Tasmannia lanceolata TaxID=3420 RepID=UPI004063596E
MKRRFRSVTELASLLPIFLFLSGCNAVRDDCHSSCGTLQNITYPFRLNSDPKDCGLTQYKLDCENNRTVLHLKSKKYYVEEISYEKQVIRLLDPGLQKDNCSSLPLYLSPSDDIQYRDPYSYADNSCRITFVKCSVPMTGSLYIAATCFNTFIQDYLYVITNNRVKFSDLHPTCKIVMEPLVLARIPRTRQHNYSKIHDLLLMGFELSWKAYLSCFDPLTKGTPCLLQISEYNVQLVPHRWKAYTYSACTSFCSTPFQSRQCEYTKLI